MSKNKASILFILHLPPPIHGAAMVSSYIRGSAIINDTFHTHYINLSTSSNLQQIGKGRLVKLVTLLIILMKVGRFLIFNKVDLCYMTLTAKGPGFYKDFLVVMLVKLFRKKIIYHFHNKGISSTQKFTLNWGLYKAVFAKSKSILLSKYLYPDIAQFVTEKDVFYCPNGIPEIKNCPILQKLNLHQPCQLLFLSNMMAEKGVFILIQACKLLRDKGLLFHCHFVGDWSDITEKEFNEEIFRVGLKQFVSAHGKKYGAEKIKYFEESDVFIFPTHYHNETFGLVLLESMQYGLPAISTFEGGIPDVVLDGVTGFLVKKENPRLLADKIELLINQPELRKQMGEAGRKRYSELFTLKKFENELCKILTQALN